MKKRAYNKALTALAALSFLIASIEGYIFYREYADFWFFRILLTVQNSIKAFLFSPNISAEDVLKTLSDAGSSLELYVGLAYVVAAFVAPLCAATALFVAAERFFRKGLERWMARRQDGILIFGYNRDVKTLLQKPRRQIRRCPCGGRYGAPGKGSAGADEAKRFLPPHGLRLCPRGEPAGAAGRGARPADREDLPAG